MSDGKPPAKQPGAFARLVRAIKRALLNKSDEEYTAGLSGGEQYWDEAVAATRRAAEAGQTGGPQAPPGGGR
jgi:hypothetical protein